MEFGQKTQTSPTKTPLSVVSNDLTVIWAYSQRCLRDVKKGGEICPKPVRMNLKGAARRMNLKGAARRGSANHHDARLALNESDGTAGSTG